MKESNSTLYWLLAALAGVTGLYVYYRNSQAAQDFLSNASATSNSGGLIQDLTQLPQSVVSTVDRGFRNNNPGNIRPASAHEYNGQTGLDAQGFGIFSSMAYGIRAIAVTLKTYYNRYGLNTIDGLIRRWSATDQDAYVANVSATVGVDPYTAIDPTDPSTLALIVQGIITQENGQLLAATVTSAQIQDGVALA